VLVTHVTRALQLEIGVCDRPSEVEKFRRRAIAGDLPGKLLSLHQQVGTKRRS
jgi:hypothetical protein